MYDDSTLEAMVGRKPELSLAKKVGFVALGAFAAVAVLRAGGGREKYRDCGPSKCHQPPSSNRRPRRRPDSPCAVERLPALDEGRGHGAHFCGFVLPQLRHDLADARRAQQVDGERLRVERPQMNNEGLLGRARGNRTFEGVDLALQTRLVPGDQRPSFST